MESLYKKQLGTIKKIPILKDKALDYVFEHGLVPKDGMWLEFGTYDGRSLNKISRYTEKDVYGFDSFEGLPDDWIGRPFPKGSFNLGGGSEQFDINQFFVYPNVKLIKGWFKDSLPKFLEEHQGAISFIHIDCDIYSSTKDVFDILGHRIADGCIIVFDELLDYPNFEEHEWKAFWEFVEKNKISFEWIGCNLGGEIQKKSGQPPFGITSQSWGVAVSPSNENAAIKILKNPCIKI